MYVLNAPISIESKVSRSTNFTSTFSRAPICRYIMYRIHYLPTVQKFSRSDKYYLPDMEHIAKNYKNILHFKDSIFFKSKHFQEQ